MATLANPATPSMVGKKAILFTIGDDPTEVIINDVDALTGLILTVTTQDEAKRQTVMNVEHLVVQIFSPIIRWIILHFFKK